MSFLLNFVYEHWKAFLVFSIIGIMGIVLLASRQFGFTVATTITDKNTEIGNLAYEKYDGATLEGSEVINAIKRYQNELPIIIYTGESEDTYHGNFKVSNNDRKSEKYIKPSQSYNGSLLRDTNQEVVGMVFAKEGITLTETSNKELLAKILGKDAENSNMSDLINEVTTVITNKDATIQALNQTIDSLNGSVSNLQSQNSNLNSQLSNANNKYNTLSGEVDAGKASIAEAITNKGVATSESDSFFTMASNINNIPSGTHYVTGTVYGYYDKTSGSGFTQRYIFTVNNLSFTPSVIFGIRSTTPGNGAIFIIKENNIIINTEPANAGTYITFTEKGFTLSTYANTYSGAPILNYYAFE